MNETIDESQKFEVLPAYASEVNKMMLHYHPNYLLNLVSHEKNDESILGNILKIKDINLKSKYLSSPDNLEDDFLLSLDDVIDYYESLGLEENKIDRIIDFDMFDVKRKKSKDKQAPKSKLKLAPKMGGAGDDKKKKKKELEIQLSNPFKKRPDFL